jgi:small basic protein
VNYNKKHPYRDAVPIDYKVAMVLLPCIFLGISIGVMFHTMVPNVIQEVLLISVLIFCLREAITKGIKFWKQETLDKQKAKLSKY